MGASLRILKSRGIAVLRYWDHFTVQQGEDTLAAYHAHPDAAPGQKHLVDFSGVTSFDPEYVGVLALQAKTADIVLPEGFETILVMYAPNPTGLDMAVMVRKSWEHVPAVIPLIAETKQQAIEYLGQKENDLSLFFDTEDI
ncbi:hypothetical protein [Yoonia sp. 208BN28-4]|uniref:hypothetical protein n=1 Tax=Yoonia sp. 208BN28-4 TaxID=3126505 RepID=UPI0030A31A4B